MINARAETVAEKPSFRNAFKNRRCLIAADSFYEWKRSGNQKTPMRIKMRSNEPFGMAGLWESWNSPEGKVLHTCTVITTAPNELMLPIHDRMPAIIRREDEKVWLDPSNHQTDTLLELLKPFNHTMMEAFEVSPDVNSPKNNSPNLITPVC